MRGTNQFVNINQVQTEFDNIPQVGFSTFTLNIFGGTNGLLMTRKCPSPNFDGKDGGPTRFDLDSYEGLSKTIMSANTYVAPGCISYGVSIPKIKKCVGRTISARPTIESRGQVRYVKYYVRGKYVRKVKRSPFRARLKVSNSLRPGKTYKYKIKAYFKPTDKWPKGRVRTKTAKFTLCK